MMCFIFISLAFSLNNYRTGSGSKVLDKSMETIEENKEGSVTESMTDNQSTKSEGSGVTTRKAERRSERQRAKRQIFVNGQSESKENVSNQKAEQKRKSVTPHRILTSDYSSEEGEREDPPSRPGSAYEIYKQAGEWWKYVCFKLHFCALHLLPIIF